MPPDAATASRAAAAVPEVASAPALALVLENEALEARYANAPTRASRNRRLRLLNQLQARHAAEWGGIGAVAEAFGLAYAECGDIDTAIDWYRRAISANDGSASLKAAEQLCNQLARRAGTATSPGPGSDAAAAPRRHRRGHRAAAPPGGAAQHGRTRAVARLGVQAPGDDRAGAAQRGGTEVGGAALRQRRGHGARRPGRRLVLPGDERHRRHLAHRRAARQRRHGARCRARRSGAPGPAVAAGAISRLLVAGRADRDALARRRVQKTAGRGAQRHRTGLCRTGAARRGATHVGVGARPGALRAGALCGKGGRRRARRGHGAAQTD